MTKISQQFSYRLLLILAVLYSQNALATITPLQSLNFGTLVVTDNSFTSSVTIDPSGNMQVVGGIAIISSGTQGVYELSDFPQNRTLNVDITVINAQMIGQISSEETFSFSVITNSNTLITDTNGMATLRIGGKIETSGNNSIRFSDTQFDSTIQIDVNF